MAPFFSELQKPRSNMDGSVSLSSKKKKMTAGHLVHVLASGFDFWLRPSKVVMVASSACFSMTCQSQQNYCMDVCNCCTRCTVVLGLLSAYFLSAVGTLYADKWHQYLGLRCGLFIDLYHIAKRFPYLPYKAIRIVREHLMLDWSFNV